MSSCLMAALVIAALTPSGHAVRTLAFIENKDTYITCKSKSDVHTFQGAAMGTSWENGRPYVQFKFGNKIERACGY